MKQILFGLVFLSIAAGAVSAHDGKHHAAPKPLAAEGGVFQGGSLHLAKVTLTDQNGHERPYPWGVAEKGLLVMTFGYTTCESLCPLGNAVMAQLEAHLGSETPSKVRLVSVTIDPETDTPDVLRETSADFGASDDWFWLTGDRETINRLLRSAAIKTGDPELHDPVFLVGDPRSGRFYRSQSMPTADELMKIIRSFPR
ncbi:protein SCO1/2 [Xaviernesmea oryzae]|uniref:Protein SCO1/2 n=1 Tax=Xaviernesmea oryzae TaxID=464029 RepID=A0A1X7FY73_9HYPH|nr:SCO family protein [Xaviernesmea oryzae]SMF60898.1 protein SCO1/2 [Xaviernesmea oryzae]